MNAKVAGRVFWLFSCACHEVGSDLLSLLLYTKESQGLRELFLRNEVEVHLGVVTSSSACGAVGFAAGLEHVLDHVHDLRWSPPLHAACVGIACSRSFE